MNLKRSNIINRWIDRLMYKFAVRSGPFMYRTLGEWRFVDHYGNLYRIVYTGDPNMPLQFSILERN